MSFTYTTLKSAIEEYTQNTQWGGTSQIDTIIKQAEERINYVVQIANYNTKTKSGQLALDGASVTETDSETGPLAPVYFKVRPRLVLSCSITNTSTEVTTATTANISAGVLVIGDGITAGTTVASVDDATTITLSDAATATDASASLNFTYSGNAWSYLLLKDYNFLQEYAPVDATTGTPKYYAFYNDAEDVTPTNAGTFSFAPVSSGDFDYETLYFFQPASLVTVDVAVADTETWLSTHGANALLYACLVEAYTFMKGESDLMQLYDAKFKEALQTLVMTEQGNYRTSFRDRQKAA